MRFQPSSRFAVLLLFVVLILGTSGVAYGLETQFPEYYKQLSGIWEPEPTLVGHDGSNWHYSWGDSKSSQIAVVIDLGGQRPYLDNTVQALAIKAIKKIGAGAYEVTCLWVNAGDQYDDLAVQIIIHVESKDKIWFQWVKGEGRSYDVGPDHPLYRTAGPQ